ncbi:MAG: FAD-dependent monooxygenase [Hyphomicrobiaceae bacterium]|nr:FAD-dependent monooxygenase [Hyphomicrobiaceae bacterium]
MSAFEHFDACYDAIVVGARCAGAATALLLARGGARVLLVDRLSYGADVTSTHALMRGGVLQLARWGLLDRIMSEPTPAVRNTTFHYGRESVTVPIKAEHGVTHLCAPRRTVLDRILVDAAREAGAGVHHGVGLESLVRDPNGHVVGARLRDVSGTTVTVAAAIVIGADGRGSTVAKQVNAQFYKGTVHASGCVYGYWEGIEDSGFHWHFGDGVAAGVIPTNYGQHCVFVAIPGNRFADTFRGNAEAGFRAVLAQNSPALRDTVSRGRLAGRMRGFAGATGYFRQSFGPGWALVGDAGYFKDPLTAHGMTDALRDAELLARAVLDGSARSLACYQQERDSLSARFLEITDGIASFGWTLDEARALHSQLSVAMKAEVEHIARLSFPSVLAA